MWKPRGQTTLMHAFCSCRPWKRARYSHRGWHLSPLTVVPSGWRFSWIMKHTTLKRTFLFMTKLTGWVGKRWNVDGETQLSVEVEKVCVGASGWSRKGECSPWIDLCDAGIWVYLRKGNPTLLGPTQTHDHYSGIFIFKPEGGSLDWTREYILLLWFHIY